MPVCRTCTQEKTDAQMSSVKNKCKECQAASMAKSRARAKAAKNVENDELAQQQLAARLQAEEEEARTKAYRKFKSEIMEVIVSLDSGANREDLVLAFTEKLLDNNLIDELRYVRYKRAQEIVASEADEINVSPYGQYVLVNPNHNNVHQRSFVYVPSGLYLEEAQAAHPDHPVIKEISARNDLVAAGFKQIDFKLTEDQWAALQVRRSVENFLGRSYGTLTGEEIEGAKIAMHKRYQEDQERAKEQEAERARKQKEQQARANFMEYLGNFRLDRFRKLIKPNENYVLVNDGECSFMYQHIKGNNPLIKPDEYPNYYLVPKKDGLAKTIVTGMLQYGLLNSKFATLKSGDEPAQTPA